MEEEAIQIILILRSRFLCGVVPSSHRAKVISIYKCMSMPVTIIAKQKLIQTMKELVRIAEAVEEGDNRREF